MPQERGPVHKSGLLYTDAGKHLRIPSGLHSPHGRDPLHSPAVKMVAGHRWPEPTLMIPALGRAHLLHRLHLGRPGSGSQIALFGGAVADASSCLENIHPALRVLLHYMHANCHYGLRLPSRGLSTAQAKQNRTFGAAGIGTGIGNLRNGLLWTGHGCTASLKKQDAPKPYRAAQQHEDIGIDVAGRQRTARRVFTESPAPPWQGAQHASGTPRRVRPPQ